MHKLVGPKVTYTRSSFAMREDWFVFLLPQSVFKIHPLYDHVVAQIVALHSNIHVVVTGGRRQRWTKIYMNRLHQAIRGVDSTGEGICDRGLDSIAESV